jgi:hypothetical protein
VLAAPFVQMMTMYDYGCEKHYGRPVPSRGKDAGGFAEMKRKIAEAEARLGAQNG